MTQLARLVNLAAVLLAVAFFAAACRLFSFAPARGAKSLSILQAGIRV